MSELVSVVIPCFNCEKHLHVSIDSVINQTYQNIEIIVVDDGSRESCREIIAGYSSQAIPIIYLQEESSGNYGALFARLKGVSASRGEYVSFLDADDYYLPSRVESLVRMLSGNPDAVLVHSNVDVVSRNPAVKKRFSEIFYLSDKQITYNYLERSMLKTNFICNSSVLAKRSALLEVTPSIEIYMPEDWAMWVQLSSHGEFIYSPSVYTGYLIHDQSETSNKIKAPLKAQYGQLELLLSYKATAPMFSDVSYIDKLIKKQLDRILIEYKADEPRLMNLIRKVIHRLS